MLKAATQGGKIGFDLVLIGIAHVRVEIEPREKVGGVLDEGCRKLSFGKTLGSDIVRQHRLPRLLGEDDDRQLARADLLTVFENLDVLKILDIYPVEFYLASRNLGVKALLQFITFRPGTAGWFVEAFVSHESRRAQSHSRRFRGRIEQR
jgi:hypothetical protein